MLMPSIFNYTSAIITSMFVFYPMVKKFPGLYFGSSSIHGIKISVFLYFQYS